MLFLMFSKYFCRDCFPGFVLSFLFVFQGLGTGSHLCLREHTLKNKARLEPKRLRMPKCTIIRWAGCLPVSLSFPSPHDNMLMVFVCLLFVFLFKGNHRKKNKMKGKQHQQQKGPPPPPSSQSGKSNHHHQKKVPSLLLLLGGAAVPLCSLLGRCVSLLLSPLSVLMFPHPLPFRVSSFGAVLPSSSSIGWCCVFPSSPFLEWSGAAFTLLLQSGVVFLSLQWVLLRAPSPCRWCFSLHLLHWIGAAFLLRLKNKP